MSACKLCKEPLFLNVEEEDVEEEKVPDDLALSCGCHFHWYVLAICQPSSLGKGGGHFLTPNPNSPRNPANTRQGMPHL